MQHFISFQKLKGIHLAENPNNFYDNPEDIYNNGGGRLIVNRINHELMSHGFILDKRLFSNLITQNDATLQTVYNDIVSGLKNLYGDGGYEPIYKNFPQAVLNASDELLFLNAFLHYITFGAWRPEDDAHLSREFKVECVNLKPVSLISKETFDNIFYDLIYSGDSLSNNDKAIVEWFINHDYGYEYNKIPFLETKAFVGSISLAYGQLPSINSANEILRIYAVSSGGDAGLKENVKFRKLSNREKRAILYALNACGDLEEAFKTNREKWLKVLFYLNPLTAKNRKAYKMVAKYADLLRNQPKQLRTFASRVEEALRNKDVSVFRLLSKRKGYFMRRINELYSVFGIETIDAFVNAKPSFEQLVTLYNYFDGRRYDKERSVVLASESASKVNSFGTQTAMDVKVVDAIQAKLKSAMDSVVSKTNKKVYIDRKLYFSPIATNNRASSNSINNITTGTSLKFDGKKVIRAYVHWVDRYDIDLSAFIFTENGFVEKIGWNGSYKFSDAVVYSGDNTGRSYKNAEYLDFDLKKLRSMGITWVICDAKVYSGPNFNRWGGAGVHAGFMLREFPEANNLWLPETVENAIKIESKSSSAYLFAIDVVNSCVVYLDVAQNESNVTNDANAKKILSFTKNIALIDDGSTEVNWNKFGQGHILNMLSSDIVSDRDSAELVFDENTPWETVSRAMTEARL